MPNVHTLRDIENRGTVEGSLALRGSIKTASDITNDYKDLQDIYLEQVKDFNRICSDFNNKFSRLNTANTELKAKYSAEIKSLKSNIKILERETTLAQKASFADKVQILFLEVKIRELEGKLEDIDLERTYYDLDVMGGMMEKPVEMPKLPDWLYDNLRSIVCELEFKDKVMELDKKLAKEDILEVLQKVIGGTDIFNTTLALPHLCFITGSEADIATCTKWIYPLTRRDSASVAKGFVKLFNSRICLIIWSKVKVLMVDGGVEFQDNRFNRILQEWAFFIQNSVEMRLPPTERY
ncbi:19108_t:CDS:2 [Rhizophagus irregularis]|nr:19108_t:CDS:2 [Rhizophagus irregularis]